MGINITNNFNPRFGDPLDGRVVVANYAERDALVANGLAYEGMIVYTKDNGADLAVMEQYVNAGTVAIPDLQWLPLGGGGGGTTIHNDLASIQGGISNTEHYHLTKRQHDWVVDTVPFTAPVVILSSNKGPTWAYNQDLGAQEPIILNSQYSLGEGSAVSVRLWDVLANNYLVPDQGGQDLDGWVPVISDNNLTYTFPSGTYPVDTALPDGDSHQYRTDLKYLDLDGVPFTITDNLTYRSAAQFINEIWISDEGYYPLALPGDPPATPENTPPSFSLMTEYTAAQAEVGFQLVGQAGYPTYLVIVVSDDLTGGDPSKIQIKQNGFVVYQYGVPGSDQLFTMTQPFTGNTTGTEPANPPTTFIQLSVQQNVSVAYQVFILP